VTTLAGSGSGTFADGTGSAASFNQPTGVAYSTDGSTIAVVDISNNRVRLI
jgi:DNA-binding beta-propeller fold protein YncE